MLDQGKLHMAFYWRLKHVIRHIEGLASCLYHFRCTGARTWTGILFFLSMAGDGDGIDVSPFLHVCIGLVYLVSYGPYEDMNSMHLRYPCEHQASASTSTSTVGAIK